VTSFAPLFNPVLNNFHSLKEVARPREEKKPNNCEARLSLDLPLMSEFFQDDLEGLKKCIKEWIREMNREADSDLPPDSDYELIVNSKMINAKTDTVKICLKETYQVLKETANRDILETWPSLYKALKITLKRRKDTLDSYKFKKLIKNNINYKIKNLMMTYPHLHFYGDAREFNLYRLQQVPEVLLYIGSECLKERFQSLPCRRSSKKQKEASRSLGLVVNGHSSSPQSVGKTSSAISPSLS